ncbi:ZIP family metal transporter [Brevibacillus halotolerans]|uniref:ZIP family metal transporter n=2 Tax=Brevibacillus TaxID=55080 RepID=A0ABT4HYY8_9BACL|nr:ZIP family metal transporter [Brevibacillus halotolerans]
MWHPPISILLLLVCAASLLGSFTICFRKKWSEQALFVMISLGGGILLSLTVLDLLPHAMGDDAHQFLPLVLVGFMLLFLLESIRHDQGRPHTNNLIGISFGFFMHAFFEGFSIAAGLDKDAGLAFPLLIALILHRLPDGITVSSLLLAATGKRGMALLGGLGLCGATILGAMTLRLAGHWISEAWTSAGLALSAGVFLYVAASHLVPLIQNRNYPKLSLYFCVSMLLYMVFSLFFHTHPH